MTIVCALCGRENETARGAFNGVCEGCGGFLHSCLQCRLFCEASKGCSSSTTEEQGDPSHVNFCEEFEPLGRKRGGDAASPKKASGETARKFLDLFGGGGEGREG